jgi:hypothetical protein
MAASPVLLQQSQLRRVYWKRWGPYVSERAWGTVREDYSPHGTAWDYLPLPRQYAYAQLHALPV